MRKRFAVLVALLAVLAICFSLPIACEKTPEEPEVLHVIKNEWFFDAQSHWKVCEDCGEKFESGIHDFDENGCCKVCGQPVNGSKGLEFTRKSDGNYYVSGAGTATGDILIPLYYAGYPVTGISENAFENCTEVTSVAIPDSIKEIGGWAFAGCTALTDVNIGNGVEKIGYNAFENCVSLKSIAIPSSVGYLSSGLFYNSGIENITVDESNGVYKSVDGNVLSKDGKTFVFYAVGKSQTSFTVPSGVEKIDSGAFGTAKLVEIVLQDGVKTVGNAAFEDCSELESVSLPQSVTEMGNYAFSGCLSIEKIDIPSGVKTIGSVAFGECAKLKTIVIPDSVTELGRNVFYCCDSLESIVIGDGITSLYDYAFAGLPALRTVEIGKGLEYYEFDATLFLESYNVESVVFDSENEYYTSADGMVLSKEGDAIYYYAPVNVQTSLVIKDGIKTINNYAFAYSKNLQSVTLAQSVRNIYDHAFAGCSGLTSVTLNYGIVNMGSDVFSGCDNLTEIFCEEGEQPAKWSNSWNSSQATVTWGVDNVKNDADFDYIVKEGKAYITKYKSDDVEVVVPQQIGGYDVAGFGTVFTRNKNIVSVYVPSTVKEIGPSAFEDCIKLASVTFSEGLQSIGSFAFDGCTALNSVVLPNSLKEINGIVFYGCTSLENVYIGKELSSSLSDVFRDSDKIENFNVSEENASYKSIDGNLYSKDGTVMYRYASGKEEKSFTVPEGVKTLDWHCFEGSVLEEIVLPEGLEKIMYYALADCANLKSVKIPSSVVSISSSAFENCGVESVIFADVNGWSVYDFDIDATGISADAISDPATAADYLTDRYLFEDWKKSA